MFLVQVQVTDNRKSHLGIVVKLPRLVDSCFTLISDVAILPFKGRWKTRFQVEAEVIGVNTSRVDLGTARSLG